MIRGEVHLIFRDINTGKITKEQKGFNSITNYMLGLLANTNIDRTNVSGQFGEYIFIGGHPQPTDREEKYLYSPLGIGRTESGIDSPRLLSGNVGTGGTFAYYYEYQQRFDPPTTTINIYTVGVGTRNAVTIPTYNIPIEMAAYLYLASPCVQTPTETLDVFYRIIWDNPIQSPPDGVYQNIIEEISQRHMNTAGTFTYSLYGYPAYSYFSQAGSKALTFKAEEYWNHGYRGYGTGNTNLPYSGGTFTYDELNYARLLDFTVNLTQLLGRLIGTVGHASNNRTLFNFKSAALASTDSPIQNIVSHDATATLPFYSASTPAQGDGTLTINGDGWTNPDFNKFLKLQIVASGGVGVGTYTVATRPLIGFLNNEYDEDHVTIPFIHNNTTIDGGEMFTSDGDDSYGDTAFSEYVGPICISYSDTQMLAIMFNWIARIDVITGESKRWHASSTPSANFQHIGQVHIDTAKNIWVADELTGLFRISADGNTITKFDNTHPNLTGITNNYCYGVTSTPGKIWAVMDDSLIWTSNNGSTFTVYNSGTTPAYSLTDPTDCWFIAGDPNNANDRLSIVLNESTTPTTQAILRLSWWDRISGHGNTSSIRIWYDNTSTLTGNRTPQRRRELFQLVSCSPDNSVWVTKTTYDPSNYSPAFWNYDALTPSYIFPSYIGGSSYNAFCGWWTKDINGNDAYLTFRYEGTTTFHYALHKQDLTLQLSDNIYRDPTTVQGVIADNFSYTLKGIKTVLDSGMFIFSKLTTEHGYYISPVSNFGVPDGGEFKNIIWKEYGWNGSNWVQGTTNPKTIHATDDALVEGLTISWDDAGATQTFIAGDYYTTGICDGVLIDGGTEITHQYALYYKNVDYNRSDVDNSGVLPGTTSYARYQLNDSEKAVITDKLGIITYDPTGGLNLLDASSGSGGRWNYPASDYAKYSFAPDAASFINNSYIIAGFADASKIGTIVSDNQIDFGVKITEVTNSNGKIEIVQNGTIVATIVDYTGLGTHEGDLNIVNMEYHLIHLERLEGSTNLTVKYKNNVVHTFTGVTNILVPTFYSSHSFFDIKYNNYIYGYSDYHIALGNSGATTGSFDPDFYRIDTTFAGKPKLSEIKLNGTTITSLTFDSPFTALSTGEVDLNGRSGMIRFSASDIGKTLTIDRYNVLLHQ